MKMVEGKVGKVEESLTTKATEGGKRMIIDLKYQPFSSFSSFIRCICGRGAIMWPARI